MRGAYGRARTRHVFTLVADDIGGVEDQEEDRNEDEAPVAPEIEPVQAHEAGAEPEQVGDEERRSVRSFRAAAGAATKYMATTGKIASVPQ